MIMVGAISGAGSYVSMYRYQPPAVQRAQAGKTGSARNQESGQAKADSVGVQASGIPSDSPWAAGSREQKPRPVPPSGGAFQGEGKEALPDRYQRKGVDPAEYAVRMRIQYMEPEGSELPGQSRASSGIRPVQEAAKDGECQTCEQRKYQDGSDDMGVSFKTPTRIAPERAGAMVRSHEQEHVSRERAKAEREDRRVVSQSVTLHTDICPECGKVYISGGTTQTTTASKPEQPDTAERVLSAVA